MANLAQRLYNTAYLAWHARGQGRYPFRALPVILADQSRRVQAMVAYGYQYVPYYRETLRRLGLTPDDFRSAADLSRLPILEREDIQRDPARFFSTAFRADEVLELRSGGTTGLPCTVRHDARSLFLNAAHGAREGGMISKAVGRAVGYRKTTFAAGISTAMEVHAYLSRRALISDGWPIERQFLQLSDPVEVNIDRLNAFQPDLVHCHGSYLEWLFVHVTLHGQNMHLPRLIMFSSDGLSPAVRELITGQLGIPVLGIYESVECFKMAFECMEHCGMHVNVDLCALRIVDREGRDVPLGTSGDVVVSNLVNRATVLLNYRLRDLATLLLDRCPCGRALPLLSFIEGRADDWIELPSGALMHPTSVRSMVTALPGVLSFQLVQHKPARWTAYLVVAPDCDRAATASGLRAGAERVLGFPVQFDVQFVDHLKTTPGGKVRPILSLRGRSRVQQQSKAALEEHQ